MELRWHQSSEDHIAGHGITWGEAKEAAEPPTVNDTTARGPLRVLGQTNAGRLLALLVTPDEGKPTFYVITAREMNDSERRRYRRRKGKG